LREKFVALLTKARLAAAVPEVCGKKVTVKVTDWPAARTTGNEIPLRTNSALVLPPEEIVTDEPVALSVPVKDAFDPVVTLSKFSAEGVAVNCPAGFSLPDKAMFSCGLEASERIARLPETEPEAVDVKTTLNVRLCPAPRLAGSDKPLTENAPLDMAACETMILAVPLLFRVSVKVREPPAGRFPKLRLPGEAAIRPAAAIPEPVKATLVMVVVVVEAYLHLRCLHVCADPLTETEPMSLPTERGVNAMFRRALCPGERVNGHVSPLTAKPIPLTLTVETLEGWKSRCW
jgi:hypothetical protein